MNIIIINGPNLNMLGYRDPKLYGAMTLLEMNEVIKNTFPKVNIEFHQSNHEGEIIDIIHSIKLNETKYNGVIINGGGYTHTSIAIGDALELLEIPIIEVHLSQVDIREKYRQNSFISPHALKKYIGEKEVSYLKAVEYITKI